MFFLKACFILYTRLSGIILHIYDEYNEDKFKDFPDRIILPAGLPHQLFNNLFQRIKETVQ